MPDLLPNTLPSLSHASILVIGDVMLDRYWSGDTSRISPEAPVPIVKVNEKHDSPGGAGNVALNIAALGAKAILLGLTGEDEAADILCKQLTAASVQHDLCRQNALATIIKLRVISRHQQLLRLDFEDKALFAGHDILLARFKQHLPQATLVILSDYQKGSLADPQTLIQLARAAQVPVLVDPKGNDFSRYQQANIITPNFKEFEAIVGPCRNEQELLSKGRALLADYHIDTLLVTRGEDGMTLVQQESELHLPAYAREVLDVTGAGDTVISTLGTAVAAGIDLAQATALANLAASIVVGKLGAANASVAELTAALGTLRTLSSKDAVPPALHGSLFSGFHGNAPVKAGACITDETQLLATMKALRASGKKIVFTNGCFDILHAGHVDYLQRAKQLGDYLIVAINTDASIRTLKGPGRPINVLEHRMAVLAGLGVVDCVVSFDDATPERLLHLIRPDTLVKGGEYTLGQVVGADIVYAYGGDVRILGEKILSSTSIMDRVLALTTAPKPPDHGPRQQALEHD